MSRVPTFFGGVVTGALLLVAAMNFHVVRSRDGVHLVAKRPARLAETYVDVRSYSMTDWANHPQLASALVQANKQHLVGEGTIGSVRDGVNQLLPDRTVR